MHRDWAIDFLWVCLAFLFFMLAGFHGYLAVTTVLEVKIPKSGLISNPTFSSSEKKVPPKKEASEQIALVVNSFINSYNQSCRLSNIFALSGYAVAGITCLFCLIMNRNQT